MGYDPKPVNYTDLHCTDCFRSFEQVSTTGRVSLCPECTGLRVMRLHSNSPDLVLDILPVPGDRVVCGMRKHLPRSERGHDWVSMGMDTRHGGEFGTFTDMEVFVCLECGRDKQKSIPVPGAIVDLAALNALIAMAEDGAQFQAMEFGATRAVREFKECVEALNVKKVLR
jgi:DNA-directed RNA polymerase subunit RPC12/RpoP